MLVLYNESLDDLIFYHYDEDMKLIYNYISIAFEEWRSFESTFRTLKQVEHEFMSYGYEVICEC